MCEGDRKIFTESRRLENLPPTEPSGKKITATLTLGNVLFLDLDAGYTSMFPLWKFIKLYT